MSYVVIRDIKVLSNPAGCLDPYQFEIEFECFQALEDDLEWRLTYVGSSDSAQYDQVLDTVFVGPVPVGTNKFSFQADAPDFSKILPGDILGVTVVLLSCHYKEKEFVRVGYYVNNELDDPEAMEKLNEMGGLTDLSQIDLQHVRRLLATDQPRVTEFYIDWDANDALMKQFEEDNIQAQIIAERMSEAGITADEPTESLSNPIAAAGFTSPGTAAVGDGVSSTGGATTGSSSSSSSSSASSLQVAVGEKRRSLDGADDENLDGQSRRRRRLAGDDEAAMDRSDSIEGDEDEDDEGDEDDDDDDVGENEDEEESDDDDGGERNEEADGDDDENEVGDVDDDADDDDNDDDDDDDDDDDNDVGDKDNEDDADEDDEEEIEDEDNIDRSEQDSEAADSSAVVNGVPETVSSKSAASLKSPEKNVRKSKTEFGTPPSKVQAKLKSPMTKLGSDSASTEGIQIS